MPTAAARLTEAHRLTQVRLAAITLRQVRTLWPLLDLEDLDGTFERWLRATVPVVNSGRAASSRLAANYWAAHRALNLGLDAQAATPILAQPVSAAQLTGTLLVTGPGSIKTNLANGVTLEQAAATAEAESARAAIYYTQEGGRETLTETVGADRTALGWARATSGESCAFCLMLSGRGPVYSEGTVDFEAHPGCNCAPEPHYSRTQDWPAGSREARERWNEATKGERDPLNAFRRAIESDRRT